MSLEEYLGHLNDKLMLDFSNMSEMPEMEDWIVFQVVEKAVERLKEDYVLVHKSHVVLSAKELHGRTDLQMKLQASAEGSVSMLQPFPEYVVPIVADTVFADLKNFLERPFVEGETP